MMKAVSGYSLKAVRDMITAIHEQTGTPQQPVDWSEPDLWISERLSGEDAEIARRIWDTDNHILNHATATAAICSSTTLSLT